MSDVTSSLIEFLSEATTPFHAVSAIVKRLSSAGFTPWDEASADSPAAGSKHYWIKNGSTVIAFTAGKDSADAGIRLVGAHTDSPNLAVKPNPHLLKGGCHQLSVDVYGGVLLNPWFDRDLSLAGRVTYLSNNGSVDSCLIDFRRAIAVIPSLAIHLDREANKSRSINPQTDLPPVLSLADGDDAFDLSALLSEQIALEHPGLAIDKILDWELSFYDSQMPAVTGLRSDFVSSARLDNLLSCFAGMEALLASADNGEWNILVANDHEEVGSASAVGAQGPMLNELLDALTSDDTSNRALRRNSWMMSVDNAHAIHPNYTARHDDHHAPLLGGGPVIKINRNQRYATTGEGSGRVKLLAERVGIESQTFVMRADLACGSTIGPITATETGIDTTDIGVPTLAMHSIRELAAAKDVTALVALLTGFYNRVV